MKSIQEKKRYRQVVAVVVVVIVVVVVVVVVVLSSKAIFSLAVALNSFYPLRLFPAKITTKYLFAFLVAAHEYFVKLKFNTFKFWHWSSIIH